MFYKLTSLLSLLATCQPALTAIIKAPAIRDLTSSSTAVLATYPISTIFTQVTVCQQSPTTIIVPATLVPSTLNDPPRSILSPSSGAATSTSQVAATSIATTPTSTASSIVISSITGSASATSSAPASAPDRTCRAIVTQGFNDITVVIKDTKDDKILVGEKPMTLTIASGIKSASGSLPNDLYGSSSAPSSGAMTYVDTMFAIYGLKNVLNIHLLSISVNNWPSVWMEYSGNRIDDRKCWSTTPQYNAYTQRSVSCDFVC